MTNIKNAALLLMICTLMSGCVTAAGALASNEDVQDMAIDTVGEFLDF